MQFSTVVTTDKYRVSDSKKLESLVPYILKFTALASTLEGVPSSLNIIFTDDEEITQINEDFLKHEGPTDVISFDYIDEYDEADYTEEDPFELGELYISLDTAQRQADEFNQTFAEEAVLYIVHGVLHLTGYDDHCDEDIADMRAAEKAVMDGLKKIFSDFNIFEKVQ